MNSMPSERCAVLGGVEPDAYSAGLQVSAGLDVSKFNRVMAIIETGTLGASATLDAKLQQCQDSGGTGLKDITGAAITQLTQAGGDSDKYAIIEVNVDQLDVENGFDHVLLSITGATAASDYSGIVLGFDPRYAPASDNDTSDVVEIVQVPANT